MWGVGSPEWDVFSRFNKEPEASGDAERARVPVIIESGQLWKQLIYVIQKKKSRGESFKMHKQHCFMKEYKYYTSSTRDERHWQVMGD
jgi:hypothetical protein